MMAEMAKDEDREQTRERINALRFVGGLLLMVALLLYFFHLAEAPMGHSTIGVLACIAGAIGAGLLWVGWRKLRALQ
jgi:protein-S-isoprenylcysteine O-methyltransferase Ste14